MFIPRDSRLVIETLFYIQSRQFILRQKNSILAPPPIRLVEEVVRKVKKQGNKGEREEEEEDSE